MSIDSGDLRNLKDFLLLYNKISEDCFKKCVYDMTIRSLPNNEGSCISLCVQKHINVNHKTMEVFSEINPPFQARKAEEREAEYHKMQAELKNNPNPQDKGNWFTNLFNFGSSSTVSTSPSPAVPVPEHSTATSTSA